MIVSFRSVSAELWSLEPAPSPCHTELWPVQSAMQQWPHDTDTLCIYHSSLLALFQSTELQASDNSSRSNGDPLKLCPPSSSQRPLRAWHLAFEHVHFRFQVHNHEFFYWNFLQNCIHYSYWSDSIAWWDDSCSLSLSPFCHTSGVMLLAAGFLCIFFSSSALVRWC